MSYCVSLLIGAVGPPPLLTAPAACREAGGAAPTSDDSLLDDCDRTSQAHKCISHPKGSMI